MQIFFKKGLRADVWCNLAVLIRVLYHPQILVYHFWLPHAIPQFLSWHPMMLYMLSVAPQRHWPSLYVTINSLKASIKSVVQVLRHKAIQCMSSPFSPVLHTLPFFPTALEYSTITLPVFLLLPVQRWQPWDRDERRHKFRTFVMKQNWVAELIPPLFWHNSELNCHRQCVVVGIV